MLRALVDWLVEAVAEANAQSIPSEQFQTLLKSNLEKTWARRAPSGQNKEVTRWVVKMVNEQIIHSIAQLNEIGMDYIAFRHGVSLLNDLHVCWDTRALPGRQNGWTVFATSDGQPPEYDPSSQKSPATLALEMLIWLSRHVPKDEVVAAAIIENILSDPYKSAGFSLIHEVRALTCHKLRIHGWHFDSVLRRMFQGQLRYSGYRPHLDAGAGDRLPASEEPFLVDARPYYLVTLLEGSAP